MQAQEKSAEVNPISRWTGNAPLPLLAETFNAKQDDVAGAEVDQGFLAKYDSGGRSGGDDVTGLEAHEAARAADEVGHAEDRGAGGPVLMAVPIDFKPHGEILRAGDLIRGDKPGADGVATLALDPLSGSLHLKGAFGKTIDHLVAGYVGEGFLFADVLRFLCDDNTQFNFPVGLQGEHRGMTTSSLGPLMAEMAIMNGTGSAGTAIPDSAALSE